MLGAIEAGGTKFVCAVSEDGRDIKERISIPTTTPDETMRQVYDFFRAFSIEAVGIGSFGPIDINTKNDTYGYITTTPKTAWQNFNILGDVQKHLAVPAGFTTDVNAAALGEWKHGAGAGKTSCLYMTVGTGIGVGAVINNNILEGLNHPEAGHIMVRRHPGDQFTGTCPYHSDCLEGLASGPAVEQRWGEKGSELTSRPEVWDLEAYYLAQAMMNYILILTPERIIIGGGVSKQPSLLAKVHEKTQQLLQGYVQDPMITHNIDQYIVTPDLHDDAGITGGFALAAQALEDTHG